MLVVNKLLHRMPSSFASGHPVKRKAGAVIAHFAEMTQWWSEAAIPANENQESVPTSPGKLR